LKRVNTKLFINNNGKGLTTWNTIVVDAEIQINGKRCIKQNIKILMAEKRNKTSTI
jgi:hypothetical protein